MISALVKGKAQVFGKKETASVVLVKSVEGEYISEYFILKSQRKHLLRI